MLELPVLYDPKGAYSYRSGINPAAVIALVVAVLPNLPGFLGQVGLVEVSTLWKNLYHYAWFTGFLLAMGIYYLLMARGNAGKR